jgi:2'-hydroxyisoflavone reductase
MRLLVLGGTAWLGGEIVRAALAQGHTVSCLARGRAGAVPAGATHISADRTSPDAYREVAASSWDAVVDVGRHPGQVRAACAALADTARHFVFVSSGNVYADHSRPGEDESAALLPPLATDMMESMATYGEAKVACEHAVQKAVGAQRAMLVRAGLIGGPGDLFDRSGYWPWRFARAMAAGRDVLVPDAPAQPTQLIDVRDLAQWIVRAAEARVCGPFNACGDMLALEHHLAAAMRVAGFTGRVRAAAPHWLQAQQVAPWMGPRSLPLWLPDPAYAGFSARDTRAARAAGLALRPLEATLRDTLAWELGRVPAPVPRRAGLLDEEEDALLARLAQPAG